MTEIRLTDAPDWTYLLREFYELYRFLPSGGSDKIRAHQRAVREAISRVIKANPEVRFEPHEVKPVTAHLRRAMDEARQERTAPVARTIDAVDQDLVWRYGYEKVPRGLEKSYAYAEFVGPNGPVLTDEVILGVVLFAPGCTYPAHAHKGITESYICLSGAVSENHQGVYAPGSLIFNPPEQMHRITVPAREPALLAYAWIGPRENLANQRMVFTRQRP
ncbi:MAG: dimethylsulfonioproprionate lyase family protein [Pseudomonadota bacterium]